MSQHTPQKIVSNTVVFTGALMIQKILSFLYFWFLSDRLSPERLGTYTWALSITALFSIGIDLGLSPLLIRESSRSPERTEKLLRSTLGLKALFAVATLVLLAGALFIKHLEPITVLVIATASIVMIFDSFGMSFYSVLRSRQNVFFESLGMLGFHVLVFSLGVALFKISQSPFLAMIALAAGSVTNATYAWSIVRFKFGMRTLPQIDRETVLFLLRLVPAFAISGVFVRIYNVADSVLLGYLSGEEAVGFYSVPAKVVTALQVLIPGAFIASIYPAMSYYFRTSRDMLEKIFERSIGYLLVFALPITVGLLALIPYLLTAVWPAYRQSEPVFYLMVLGLPFLFLTFPSGYLLNACDRQRQNTINRGIIAGVNIIINVILIPFLGVVGAGIAFLVSNVLLFALDFWWARRIVPFDFRWFFKITGKTAAASAVMGLAVYLMREQLPLPVTIMLGGIVYAIIILALRVFSKEEFALLRSLIRRKPVSEAVPPPSSL
ncbi:MAG: flippase [bacterium]|nr:flippase [bacterium]